MALLDLRAAEAHVQMCPLQNLPVAAPGTRETMQTPPAHGHSPCVIRSWFPLSLPQATVPPATQVPAYWLRSDPTPGPLHWLLLVPGGW